MDVDSIATKAMGGERLASAEALELYRKASTHVLGQLADAVRARKHPEGIVTYIIDRNVNYTNICVARCNFCAFYRPVGSPEGYVLGFEKSFEKLTRPSLLEAFSCSSREGTTPICPWSGTRICSLQSSRGTLRSACTRCRRRRSFISRACRT